MPYKLLLVRVWNKSDYCLRMLSVRSAVENREFTRQNVKIQTLIRIKLLSLFLTSLIKISNTQFDNSLKITKFHCV